MKYRTCESCHKEFTPNVPIETAKQEFYDRFEGETMDNAIMVCDDCYKVILDYNNPFKQLL